MREKGKAAFWGDVGKGRKLTLRPEKTHLGRKKK